MNPILKVNHKVSKAISLALTGPDTEDPRPYDRPTPPPPPLRVTITITGAYSVPLTGSAPVWTSIKYNSIKRNEIQTITNIYVIYVYARCKRSWQVVAAAAAAAKNDASFTQLWAIRPQFIQLQTRTMCDRVNPQWGLPITCRWS